MVKSWTEGCHAVRSRLAIVLVLLFALHSWSAVVLPGDVKSHHSEGDETTFRDVAVLEPFSFDTYTDYSDVAVIINNQSEDSRIIGTAFALARNIPPERVILLTNESTPTGETINSNQFTEFFAEPISEMIEERNLTDLNVLVTTKGVPLRVNGGTNVRAAFDSELALINGTYASAIFGDWYVESNYGLAAGNEMKQFNRAEQGYYLVTRLTGYDVETALGLIDKANDSFGQHGLSVLDLATNRNGSGYKWWNDLLYTANETLSEIGLPVHFNQNSTYITGMSNVSMYAAWGSNDGAWVDNQLPNSGYDTSDGNWLTGSRYWDGLGPSLSPGEQWWWTRQTETKRNGNAAMEGRLEDAPCGASDASTTNGLLAEYFDNNGVSYNVSAMVNLSGRTPDFSRHEPNIDWPSTTNLWTGLDSRFLDYWSARHTGIIHIPSDGNWTFYLNSDDGSKLWIDDIEVVDNQGHHGMRERSGVVWLEAGEHALRTEFFEHGGYAGLQLKWEGPGVSKQTVPTNVLTRGSSFPVRENALIHHWEFDEVSGDQANDSVGNAHLNFSGTNGSQWRTCVLGNCAFFDGIDDEARVDVEDSVTDFTVSLWVQANQSGQARHSSVIAVNDVAGDDDSFQFQTSGGNPGNWELYHNNSYSFGTVDPTVWQHLVATFENDTITLYMDGVEILNQSVPNGTVNSIEIYKFGVNRAGNNHFNGVIDEVQMWETALSAEEVADVHSEVVWICPGFNTTNNSIAYVEQRFQIDADFSAHTWVIDGYSMRDGWMEGNWWLEVESFDISGSSVSINRSEERSFSDDWQLEQLRFRPHADATEFEVRQVAEFSDGTYNGSIFFDTLRMYPIRPHFEWTNGSIAETAVSTGGRTFIINSSYGQSLVSDLLDDGVSGVKGYVYEPYLSAVSNPEQLLSCYANGFTMSECYAASNAFLSWMGTVIGDPKMAAYSDRLHDVNISEIYIPNRLSAGTNGSIEVLLENLAPGVANGHLEVRERLNNVLLANVNLTIPSGNEVGSRLILPVNITPSRIGFTELLVRWVPAEANPERITDNNLKTIELDINGPPDIDEVTCSTSTATRGGIVICQIEVSDDFGVSSATLSWRYNGSNASYSPSPASTQDNGTVWKGTISLPIDAPLDYVDLHWIVYDLQGESTEYWWSSAFQIIDASATWHGVHVSGVDLEPWQGFSPPIHGLQGWIRGQSHVLTACVEDVDHDNMTEMPLILVGSVELDTPIQSSSSGSKTCYQTIWNPPNGGGLEAVSVALYADGIEWSNRSLMPHDLPPQAELSDSEQYHLDGSEDHILVDLVDADDPNATYQFETSVLWPGAGLQVIQGGAVTAPPGLEVGDALIQTQIREGKWAGMEWSWSRPVFLSPPIVSAPVLCDLDMVIQEFARGESGFVWIGVEDARPVDNIGIRLSTGTDSDRVIPSVIFEEMMAPSECTPGTGLDAKFFRIQIESDYLREFPLGTLELSVFVRDIDATIGISPVLELELIGSKPVLDFSRMPTQFTSGNQSTLIVEINDLDGIENMQCSILLKDQDDITLHSQMFIPMADGLWTLDWTPPGADAANHTLYFTCLDETSLSVTESILIRAQKAAIETTNEQNTTQQGSDEQSANLMIGIVLTGTLIILILTTLLYSRKKEEFIEEEEQLPDDAWSKQSRDDSEERLAEMAGVSESESKEWTDEELLGAGWSKQQIDLYRIEQENNANSEEDIMSIFEEE